MTLMEVLVAITLVALLSVSMLYAIRTGMGSIESIRRHVTNARKQSAAQRILEQQFANLVPVFALCGAGPANSPTGQGMRIAFFDGEPLVMRFVSAYSLEEAGRGGPQILELFTVPGEGGEGVRLVVNERPYFSPYSAGALCVPDMGNVSTGPVVAFAAPIPSPRSFVLADRLARVSFSYQEVLPDAPFERWTPRWDRNGYFPAGVRIDMIPLDANRVRLEPLSFHARIWPNWSANDMLQ
jgi:hypothetical protein